MIRSMTGYGSAAEEGGALRAAVSVRSLNHRFLDVSVQLPRRLQPLEAALKARVGRAVDRGRIELAVQASFVEAATEAVVAARPLVASLVRSLRELQAEHGLEGGVTVSDVARFAGALERVDLGAGLPPGAEEALLRLVDRALEGLEAMRRGEGERLRGELERLLSEVEACAARIEARSEASREERRSALLERLRALLAEVGLDDARLYQEAARAVERHDVTEELHRLRAHAASARDLLAGEGAPAGKRLDFLAQELMREANTVGSKAQDAATVREVVELKAGVERFREQVQNVE